MEFVFSTPFNALMVKREGKYCIYCTLLKLLYKIFSFCCHANSISESTPISFSLIFAPPLENMF